MNKVTKRIRIDEDIDCFMTKLRLKKQMFINQAITEKLERDFKMKIKIPFQSNQASILTKIKQK